MYIEMRNAINKALNDGKKKFVIYPFGEQGRIFKEILNNEFGIQEEFIIDNNINFTTERIYRLKELTPKMLESYTIFLVSDNLDIYFQLRSQISKVVQNKNIIDVLLGDINTFNFIKDKAQTKKNIKVIFNQLLRYEGGKSFNTIGKNTGNFVYMEAAKEQLHYDIEVRMTQEWTKEKMGKSNVSAIMPASNFINSETVWYEDLIPILENSDMQFTLVGLGAQASFDETPKEVISKLSDKQKYFFQLAGEHTNTIGVRGEFTAECLNKMEINNVEVIGCPSFFQYAKKYPKLQLPKLDKVLYTADSSKRKIYTLAEQTNAMLIGQHGRDADYAVGKSIFFDDFEQWSEFILREEFTFAFGSRFHGNMMALRNKVPTIWVVHDWRTLELVQYLGLPYINYYDEKFKNMKYVEELVEYCNYSNVYKMYPQLYEQYCSFIRRNFDKEFRREVSYAKGINCNSGI